MTFLKAVPTVFCAALIGAAFSKLHYGSVVPPPIKLKVPGFSLSKESAAERQPRTTRSANPARAP